LAAELCQPILHTVYLAFKGLSRRKFPRLKWTLEKHAICSSISIPVLRIWPSPSSALPHTRPSQCEAFVFLILESSQLGFGRLDPKSLSYSLKLRISESRLELQEYYGHARSRSRTHMNVCISFVVVTSSTPIKHAVIFMAFCTICRLIHVPFL
jgi:hypothetical protein